MTLNFIIGRSGSGKSALCYKKISENEKNKIPSILIVPEQFSLQAEKELSKSTEGGGIMFSQVMTFGRLAFNVLNKTKHKNTAVLTETGKLMVLRKILLSQRENLKYYRKMSDKDGYILKLSDTLSELYNCKISADELEKRAEGLSENSSLRNKAADIKLIFDSYKDFLGKEYQSTDETLDLLAENIKSSDMLSGKEIYIDGFYGFTEQEISVIKELMKVCGSIYIALTIDEKSFFAKELDISHPFFEPHETVNKLKSAASDTGCGISKPIVLKGTERFKEDSIKEFEKNYFSYTFKYPKEPKGIKIFAAKDKYEEISAASARITEMVLYENYRYKDIAVLTNDFEGYEGIISKIFNEYKIPFFLDKKREVFSHPLSELIRSVLEILTKNFSYEAVFSYLKTGLTPVKREDIDKIENYCLKRGIKGKRWFEPLSTQTKKPKRK